MSSFLLRRATAASAGAARSFSTSSPRSLARITVIGNLANTPEVQTTSSGREILKYAVASNHGPRDNRQTSWFRVTSFVEGPRKDYMLTLPKGTTVYVEGDASISSYQDGNGQPRSSLGIVQRSFEVLKKPQTEQAE
ncbi:hypothetical protein E4U43_001602 [Claviceps pusilla]|uniref:Single-stranded DNA-binding protein n=1 Tax=Claviceps pusilla TaxID=123648 RepID=A0A9P7SWQ1_9HYPO|nr:hypothetical protein E4U43_001602 [Claviceps pusilla]